MKNLMLTLIVLATGCSAAQTSNHYFPAEQSFPAIRVSTPHETFTVLDVSLIYAPVGHYYIPGQDSGVLVEQANTEKYIPWEKLLAMSLVTPGQSTDWNVTLTTGEVLRGLPVELHLIGTVGKDAVHHALQTHLSVTITPADGFSHDYIAVVFPSNLD